MSLHEANNTVMSSANQLHALLLEATSDLIRASDLGELSRVTFDHVSSALDAGVCTNYRLDSTSQCLKLEFERGLPPEKLEMARLIKLGQEYCGRAAATCHPLVADRQHIASDPNGGLVRELGATAYACHPLKASSGRLLGTFAVASATREGLTNDDVAWLGTITNFLSQAWERIEAEQGLRTSEERLHQRLSEPIAERAGAERALAESEARFRRSFENAAVGIVHIATNGRYLHVNESLCRFLNYPADELVTKSFQDVTYPEDIASELQYIKRMREGKIDHYDIEKRYLRKDGAIVWGRKTVGCLRKSDGSIDYLISTVEDICKRKRAEACIAEHQAQLALFVEQTPAAIAMFDTEMNYLAASRRFITDYRVENVRVVGVSHHEIFPDIPQRWRDIHARVLAGEELSADEDPFLRPDGRIDWCRWSMKPWRIPDGRIGGTLMFSELITEQVEGRRALAANEARFRATFENAAVGIGHFTLDGRMLRFNKTMSCILGWPRDELATKRFQELTHPDDLAFELAHWEQLCDGKVNSYSVDKRILRKDGTIVWVRLTRSSVRKSDGSVDYLVAVIEDISARKHAEDQVHLLMREANHRVKNLLGLVQAIARQTAAGSPEDFTGRFTERIQALAANQDLLSRSQQRGADLEELVRGQLAHFADLIGSRIAVHGPRLHLNAAAAQAVGLALHELATNATKYGALSTDAGRVDVGWCADGDTFTMNWTERKGPPVRPPERRGVGTTVIDLTAKQTLGGEVELDYAPSGLTWRLTCPAANALERATDSHKTLAD